MIEVVQRLYTVIVLDTYRIAPSGIPDDNTTTLRAPAPAYQLPGPTFTYRYKYDTPTGYIRNEETRIF